ncbi:hypothetical protein ACSDR0_20470 [Streptosporangium sp. G11]|uniref:hypothetical protein n=1 Tax=Streptosporangium sp. G11 TaxID=3436926 RepID=UPI003EB78650
MSTVQLPFEWAVGGKLPGSGDDYKILACSQGLLSRYDFEEIRTVYTIGTPEELPQIMIAWVGSGDDAHLVLAIQNWSDEEDRRRRRIARTHYFCVPYARVTQPPLPVSYEDLHQALAVCPLPTDRQLVVSVPTLDSDAVAARIDGTVMCTAALLMTGQHVCVVGGEAVSTVERLRFIDTVAALLPYGMRARLTASTWASSTADHKIRLAFSQHVPARTYPIAWGQLAEIPPHEEDARGYLTLLARHALDADLVAWLASRTEPLTFGKNGRSRALDLLRGFKPSPVLALMPAPAQAPARAPAREPVEGLLTECADALERGGTAEIRDVLDRLDGVVASRGLTISDDERARYQKIIRDRQLLLPKDGLPEELEAFLHEVIRMAGYGLAATSAQMDGVTQEVAPPARASATAIVRRSPPDPVASMKTAYELGREELEEMLKPLQTRELVAVAARQPYDMRVVKIACDELVRRGNGHAEDPEIAEVLREHRYLTDAISALHPAGDRAQFDWSCDLLRAAYGQEFHLKQFEEVFRSPGGRSAVLVAAAVSLFGAGAGEALKKSVINLVRDSGLDRKIFEEVERRLLESESGVSHLTAAAPPRKRWFGRGRRGSGAKPLVPPFTLYVVIIVLAIIALVEFFMLIPVPGS